MRASVVIPSYNHKQFVIQAIESVLNQSWADIDLIVIDDGSTDGSTELIAEHHAQHGGYSFVSRENRGAIATLNEGVERAIGDVLCFLASDDFLLEDSLRVRAEVLIANPENIAVFADGETLIEGVGECRRMLRARQKRLFEMKDPVPEFLRGVNLPLHTMLARIEAFRKIGGLDRRYQKCEDLDPQLLLFLEGPVGYVDNSVYCYRRHGNNISTVDQDISRVDKVLCFEKYLSEIPSLTGYHKIIKKQLCRHYLRLGRYLSRSNSTNTFELELFKGASRFVLRDPRLLWHLAWQRLCRN